MCCSTSEIGGALHHPLEPFWRVAAAATCDMSSAGLQREKCLLRPGYHETIKTLFTPSSTSKSEGQSALSCSCSVAAFLCACREGDRLGWICRFLVVWIFRSARPRNQKSRFTNLTSRKLSNINTAYSSQAQPEEKKEREFPMKASPGRVHATCRIPVQLALLNQQDEKVQLAHSIASPSCNTAAPGCTKNSVYVPPNFLISRRAGQTSPASSSTKLPSHCPRDAGDPNRIFRCERLNHFQWVGPL